MSYVFVSAIGLSRDPSIGWIDVPSNQDTLGVLTTAYAEVFVKLTNTLIADPIVIDLVAAVGPGGSLANPNITIASWLSAIGNPVLHSLGKNYAITTTEVHVGPAARYDYTYKLVHPTAALDAPTLETDRTDLLLTKTGSDYLYMATHSLVAVNGYMHITDGSDHGLYVRNARSTRDISNDNQVAIISFADVASLQQIPITADMIFKTDASQSLHSHCVLDIGVSTQNKSVLLSIGGYLQVLDNTYRVVGDGLIEIDWRHIAVAERLYDSKDHIDLSSLSAIHYRNYENAIVTSEITSDTFIVNYLTLPQSFVIVVDAPILNVKHSALGRSSIAGVYVTPQEPKGIMRTRYGRVMNYWKKKDWSAWVATTTPEYDFVYLFQTTNWQDSTVITAGRDPNRMVLVDKASMTRIQKQVFAFSN